MSFETAGAALLEMLSQPSARMPRAELLGLVDTWAEEFDRGEKLDAEDGCNYAHLLGAGLCVLLHNSDDLGAANYDLREALGHVQQRVLVCERRLAEYDIEDVQNVVTALQLEFASLYRLDTGAGTGADAGYASLVDTEEICLRIMAQLGALLAVKRGPVATEGAGDVPVAAVRCLLDVDSDGYCTVSTQTFVSLLDALHSMYGLHALLTRARFVPAAGELVEVHAHHREASNETFFTHSMTWDCVVGTIAQYAHRFEHLFHSVSQTIYYNHPTYARNSQLPLSALQRENTSAVNVLPLLTELRPDIPVLFEHTGAGCRQQHAKHRWSWVLWSHFVLLVDRDMQAHVAADIRTLLPVARE